MNFMWFILPVGEMSEPTGEPISLLATVAGEMAIDDIPLATWADLQAIKAGDESPLEVVVEVPVGKSKRGWNYTPKSLQSIVGEVMATGLPGFLGHQKAENINTEFPQPVTHWVGAKFDPDVENKDTNGKVVSKGVAYFRGVVDKAADDLKRWIKAKVVRQVSIFGFPKLQKASGEINVVDYKPLSIDWTPLNRPGMPTRIVALGEMDEINGELDGSHEELREALRQVVREAMGAGENSWVYIQKTYPDKVIIEHSGPSLPSKYYSLPYSILDGKIQLGAKTEVTRKEVYEPVGEINTGGSGMNWKQLVAQIMAMIQSGEVTRAQVIGEMGLDAQTVAGEIDSNWLNQMTGSVDTLTKVKEALGVTGEMDVVTVAQTAANAIVEQRKAGRETMVNEVIKEKVTGEMAQSLVKKMLVIPEDATKETVAGEIDRILADDAVKTAIGKMHVDKRPPIGGNNPGQQSTSLRTKRQSI